MANEIDYSISYRRWAEPTREGVAAIARSYERLLPWIPLEYPRTSSVLDYGCGFGGLVMYLSRHFDDVTGLDSSQQQIEVGASLGLPVSRLPQADYGDWCSCNAERFDLIFLFDVLEHIPATEQIPFMRSLCSTLKPRGHMYIKVPNANSLLASRWRYIDHTHTSSFTEASLEFVCMNSGLGDPSYFQDDSSMTPRYPYMPRPTLLRYYTKSIYRALWKLYLWAELGEQTKHISVGYNLLLRMQKL